MKYEMVHVPRPGQFLLYVDLTAIKHQSIDASLQQLQKLGYRPQLRYTQAESGIRLWALLRDEQHNPAQRIDDFYRFEEREALHAVFDCPEEVVYCNRGLPQQQAA